MRFLFIVLFVLACQQAMAGEVMESYQQALDQYYIDNKGKKSSITAQDKAVKKQFGEELAKRMPAPGLKIGEKAPDFSLSNAFGKMVKLSDELRKGPVVLVFYRGAWCPLCNLHLRTLQQSLPQLKRHGAQLLTVTPQKPDRSAKQLTEKDFEFETLSDSDSQVMKDYKLYFELSDELLAVYHKLDIDLEAYNGKGRTVLPVPGSFVIDQDGIIQAMEAQTDYTKRMEPAAIITALARISSNF